MKSFLFDHPQRIFVTGCRAPAAADLVRWLHHQGHTVSTGDCLLWPAARASRFSQAYFQYPSPRRRHDAFVTRIRTIAAQHDLVWPCCEEVFWLAGITGLPLFAPSFALLRRLHHKGDLVTAVNTLGHIVRSPETLPLSTAIPGQPISLPSGWLAKPAYGRFGHRNVFGPAKLSASIFRDEWIMQRFIPGREVCLHALSINGHVRELVCYHDPNRQNRGPCLVFKRGHSPALENFVHSFCRHYDITGQVGFDAIIDPQDQPWILDCNARLTSGMHLIARPTESSVQLSLARRLSSLVHGRRDAVHAGPDGVDFPGDPGPARLLPLSACEIFLRSPSRLESASTVDLQWP